MLLGFVVRDNSRRGFSLKEALLWIMGWYFGQKKGFKVKMP